MAQYANSRGIGYNSWTNSNWSSFMNSYAATPLNTGATSGISGVTFFGQWSIIAPWSGNYTMRAAADDFGSCNLGGNTFSPSGFASGGNTTTRFFSKGETIVMQWSIGNSTTSNVFVSNPCAISWTLDGPDAPPFPTVNLFANPTSIIQGQSTTLSWSSSGVGLYSASLTDVSNPGYSGSATVSPQNTRTYTYTVCGERGCSSVNQTVTVYIPPQVILSLSRNPIIFGQCATLSWQTTGDASNIIIGPGVTNANLNSSSQVCPTRTTTYSATVSGLGGSDSDSIILTVYYPPTITIDAPEMLDYGDQHVINYTTQYSNISVTLYKTNIYRDGTVFTEAPITLPKPSSAQFDLGVTTVNGSFNSDIVYTDFGPQRVQYTIEVSGDGGNATSTHEIYINIDATPDNLIFDETDGKYKLEDPVYTPDIVPQEVLESNLYLVEGIDVAVEIQSNKPIQVDINQEGVWKDVRQI